MSRLHGRYWETRKHMAYYQQAVTWAKNHTPIGGKILDVGGGITMGCEYLKWLPGYERTAVELDWGGNMGGTLPEVNLIISRFEDWEPDQHYDTVMCLQCVEHVEQPWHFVQKLRQCGDRLILSVPFKWPQGQEEGHIHDPIDRIKVKTWVGREPTNDRVLGVKPYERLIGLYL